ncbi:MAG: hypothetical protein K2M90_00975 [Treponemataceae bacterium]|nr:hypothetical protein [Treponemataceae bacterium]MDE7391026.1 hypothetical protein [Treponemataceae bacterium]
MDKKFTLNLPLKVILTETGTSHFLNANKKLLRFKLADNTEEYGISLSPFSPQSIQNMILVDYISKIEISMSDFVSVRQEVMDLSKVIVYSVLYKQFDRQVFSEIIKCDCVKKHNRVNPAQIIDERTRISDVQLRLFLARQDAAIQAARKSILDSLWQSIMDNKEFSPEEKNIYLLMTEKFLNRLSLMNWYIIIRFYRAAGFAEMTAVIRRLLAKYMDKSKVAEYISILVMELALSSETTNLRQEAKNMYPDVVNIDTLIFDPEARAKIVAEMSRKHRQVFLSWKLGGSSAAIGKQGRLQVMLYNHDDEFQEVKELIESKSASDLNRKSLIDFYREIPEGERGTDLGMYYFSYLDEACKKVNVKFESVVNQFSSGGLMVISLNFNF